MLSVAFAACFASRLLPAFNLMLFCYFCYFLEPERGAEDGWREHLWAPSQEGEPGAAAA
jgi:hypothetical protein